MARSSTTRVEGQPSLNPGGRPKSTPETITALRKLRSLTPRAVERAAELLESEDERVAAMMVKEVFERNLGKAVQRIRKTVTHKKSPRDYSLEELDRVIDGPVKSH